MNILVFIEHRNAQIKKASIESLKAAYGLSGVLGGTVLACVFGKGVASLDSLGGYGATKVLCVDDERFENYSTVACTKAVQQIVEKEAIDLVFMAATALGKDLAPRVSARLDAGLAPDITSLKVENGDIIASRPVYAGKAIIEVKITSPRKIYTLRPNVFSAGASDGQTCPVEAVVCEISDADFETRVRATSISTGKIDVAEANVIVSGGRGLQGPEHWHLIEELASTLGAATGASRAVVDAGWRPHGEQVGQTGKTVSPTLYVACGISGAVQHLAGMSSSKFIVAINKDKDAPIFSIADYGIIGDVFEILPALTEALKHQQEK